MTHSFSPSVPTHLNASGEAHMVNVAAKDVTYRTARAEGFLYVSPKILHQIQNGTIPKGDILAVARIAGLMAAKKTSELIPLCHPLTLTQIDIDITFNQKPSQLHIIASACAQERTGVEMEALTAVSIACLTLYDMLKSLDREMTIEKIALIEKIGGRSGRWIREATVPEKG